MVDFLLDVFRYTVVQGKIAAKAGLQTLKIEDRENDGLISQADISRYFGVDPNGRVHGTDGPADRDVEFAIGTKGNLDHPYELYTDNSDLKIGDTVSLSSFVKAFPPFCAINEGVPCFAAQMLIETSRGQVAAGDLVAGDMVRTRDAGFQPVRWVGKRRLSAAALARTPGLCPIRIRAGSLGAGTPAADLIVSPQHRVLVRSRIAQKMFGVDEVLVAAKQLLQLDGIDLASDLAQVTYVHFLLDDHQIVFSNGAETESLYTGAEALKSVGPAAQAEIFSIFPELRDGTAERAGARMMPSGRMGRRLAVRHLENRKPLIG